MSPRRESLKKKAFKASVSKRLEMLRNHLGLDTKTMAAKMSIAVRTYRSNGKGDYSPSAESLATLAKTTPVSLNWLLTGKGDMFLRDVEAETQQALQAERAAIETQTNTDSFLREIEEMKRLMQQVPIVKYQVMAYYQQVKEEQKEIIHRHMGSRDTVVKELQTPPAPIYREPEVPGVVKPEAPKAPEAPVAPEVILPKIPGKPAAVLHTEQENREPINEELEMPPAVILKETETPDTLNKETAKPARPKVQNLFPKKRKKKRKK